MEKQKRKYDLFFHSPKETVLDGEKGPKKVPLCSECGDPVSPTSGIYEWRTKKWFCDEMCLHLNHF